MQPDWTVWKMRAAQFRGENNAYFPAVEDAAVSAASVGVVDKRAALHKEEDAAALMERWAAFNPRRARL